MTRKTHSRRRWLLAAAVLALVLTAAMPAAAAETPLELEEATPGEMSEYGYFASGIPVEYVAADSALNRVEELPETWDARAEGWIPTTLRNQNPYGICWAHAVIGTAETAALKNNLLTGVTADTIDLSEWHLAWFCTHASVDPLGLITGDYTSLPSTASENYLNYGGNARIAAMNLACRRGAADEEQTATQYSAIRSDADAVVDSAYGYTDELYMTDCIWMTASEDNRDTVKALLMQNGSAAVSLYYAASNFNTANAAYYNATKTSTNHEVLLIGWDDGYSAENFTTTPPGDGAWLCRNSYGSAWGKEGCFWVSYYDVSLLNNEADFFSWETADAAERLYQYDGNSYEGAIACKNSKGGSMGAVYTVQGDAERLTEVMACTWQGGLDYTLEIYTDVAADCTDPTQGTNVHTQSGTLEYAGYQTIALTSPVALVRGERFSVVIRLTGAEKVSLPISKNKNTTLFEYTDAVASGQTFVREGTGKWYDVAESYTGSARLKAVTETDGVCFVCFDPGEGQCDTANAIVLTGEAYGALPVPTREGYVFGGWYTASVGGSLVTAQTTVTATANHTLYARWTAGEYTVTLDAAGGTVTPGSLTAVYAGAYGALPVPTREGYVFGGWYTAAEGGDPVTAQTTVTATANHTLYARWTAAEYTVTLDAGAGSVSPGALGVSYGASYGVLPVPTRKNFVFDGWYTASVGGSLVTAQTTVTTASNHTLYAHWSVTMVFADVPSGEYYYNAVLWALENGITDGTSATTFSPSATCTRGQIVTFLWRYAGRPAVSGVTNPFRDVASDAYYYDAVLWAVQTGITVGTGATTFSPEETCTRGQIVTFLWRYSGRPSVGTANPFRDVASDAYYYEAVLWAVANGITVGTSATTFEPASYCTRGQAVTFLQRKALLVSA